MFKQMTRAGNRLRLALDGPAGAGKTYTALRFAFAIAKRFGGPVGVIDTEHGSAKLYLGQNEDGQEWQWQGVELEHFAPSAYVAAIKAAASAGIKVLVIDSLSHAWSGTGGALDQVDRAAAKTSGGSFGAWRDVTPQHNQMVDAILAFPGHVVATMRSKMEYVLGEDEKGKKTVEKIGLKPVQREGVEYEFTVVGDLDTAHKLTISKTRCSAIDGSIVVKPGEAWLLPVLDWLGEFPEPKDEPIAHTETLTLSTKQQNGHAGDSLAAEIKQLWRDVGRPAEELRALLDRHGSSTVAELPTETAKELHSRLETLKLEAEADAAF